MYPIFVRSNKSFYNVERRVITWKQTNNFRAVNDQIINILKV